MTRGASGRWPSGPRSGIFATSVSTWIGRSDVLLAYPGYLWEFPSEDDPNDPADPDSFLPYMGDTWGVPVLTRIEDARFKKIVRPGETLRAEVRLDERLAQARYLSAKVTSDGQTVVRMRFVLAITPEPAAERP